MYMCEMYGGCTCSAVRFAQRLRCVPHRSVSLPEKMFRTYEKDGEFVCMLHLSIFQSLATVGLCMPRASGVASAHDVPVVIALLQRHLQGTHGFDLYCPRVAPSVGVVSCTYHHSFFAL